MRDPDEEDAILREPLPGDDQPANITTYQAMKVAAILGAMDRGHEGCASFLRLLEHFLQAAALEARGAGITPSAEDVWHKIDALPWPPRGRPKPQPE